MPIIMRFLPAYGLAVYETANPAAPDDGPMALPGSYTDKVKFHSSLRYPALQTQFDATVTLPALNSLVGSNYSGKYLRGVLILGGHGQSDVPMIKAMLVGFNGANRPLSGSFPAQQSGNFCRLIDVGVQGSNVVLVHRAFSPANNTGTAYPAISVTVRVWVFSWVLDGSPSLYDATKPQLQLTASKITAGRGMFDTDREYIRSDTGAENTLLTNADTFVTTGSNGATSTPTWGWRYSVDGYTVEGQASGSGHAAAFKRIKLP